MKITMRYHFIPAIMIIIKKQIITSIGKDVEKLEHSHTVGRNVK